MPASKIRWEADTRSLPIRRLTEAECEKLGYAPPLQLGRLQTGRFGWWRNTKWYIVETSPARKRLMTSSLDELAIYNITP